MPYMTVTRAEAMINATIAVYMYGNTTVCSLQRLPDLKEDLNIVVVNFHCVMAYMT
jgi:hypothetical protein